MTGRSGYDEQGCENDVREDGVGVSAGMAWERCGMVGGVGRNVEASSYLPVGSRPFLEIPDSVLYGSQFGVLFVYEMITPL